MKFFRDAVNLESIELQSEAAVILISSSMTPILSSLALMLAIFSYKFLV
jgi:hypothetical protein